MGLLDDAVTFGEAAKRIGIGKCAMRNYIMARGLAIRWPSPTGKIRYRVKMSEVEKAILADKAPRPLPAILVEPELPRRRRQRRLLPREDRHHPSMGY